MEIVPRFSSEFPHHPSFMIIEGGKPDKTISKIYGTRVVPLYIGSDTMKIQYMF